MHITRVTRVLCNFSTSGSSGQISQIADNLIAHLLQHSQTIDTQRDKILHFPFTLPLIPRNFAKTNDMKVELRKTGSLYGEFITYMSYRYAIGLTTAQSEYRDRQLEQYRLFDQIEFDTPEFHALAREIAQYLKRKKIKTIADLRDREIEQQLTWFSYHYAMHRHSYAASLCDDIAKFAPQVMSPERLKFTAVDIRREIARSLTFYSPIGYELPINFEDTHGPLDTLIRFLVENGIDTEEKLSQFSRIRVIQNTDGSFYYHSEKAFEPTKNSHHIMGFSDLIGWEDLSFLLDPAFHKKCLVRYEGKEETITYFDSWWPHYNQDGTRTFERIKCPISPDSTFRKTALREEFIVKDNI